MSETNKQITSVKDALDWLRESNFSTLYPSEYARLAKQCADVLESEIGDMHDTIEYYSQTVNDLEITLSRMVYPDTTGS